jgi:predicted membrane protein
MFHGSGSLVTVIITFTAECSSAPPIGHLDLVLGSVFACPTFAATAVILVTLQQLNSIKTLYALLGAHVRKH